jgi:hypothetical protein
MFRYVAVSGRYDWDRNEPDWANRNGHDRYDDAEYCRDNAGQHDCNHTADASEIHADRAVRHDAAWNDERSSRIWCGQWRGRPGYSWYGNSWHRDPECADARHHDARGRGA